MVPETQIHENALPLTQSQSLLWLGQKLNPGSCLYNTVYSFTISGDINVQNFQLAFRTLIAKMDVFRTVFFERDGTPYQSVLPHYDYQLEVIDFTEKTDEPDIQNWLKKRTSRMFDFTLPLFDSVLLKTDEHRYIWLLNFHHIITDATSSTVIFGKMSEIYGQIRKGNSHMIADTPAFASYVSFEAEQRNNAEESVRNYWKEKIAQVREKPVFYGNKSTGSTTKAKRISVKLNLETSNNIRNLAQRPELRAFTQHLSLFNIFASLLFIYSYRVSGQKTLALGAPSHNRATSPFKETAGLIIEIFPLVASLSEKDTLRSVLKRVRVETNNYLRYAQPGMASAEISRSFNVILNYMNARFSDFDGLPTTSQWIHPDECDPAHHLRCHVYDIQDSGNIEIHLNLNEEVFNDDLLIKVPEHFSKLITALVSDIDRPILEPPLINASEKASLLDHGQLLDDNPISVVRQFERQVAARPNAIALQSENIRYNYEELNYEANRLAHMLVANGIGPGKKVLVHLERSPAYLISLLAILKSGGTFVPVATNQPEERVAFILKDSNSSLVITCKGLEKNLPSDSIEQMVLNLETKHVPSQKIGNISTTSEIDSIAYILYTSGSTGTPKGVEISQRALSNYMGWAGENYIVDDKTIFPLFTSIGFDLTLTATLLPLLMGGRVVVYPEKGEGPDMALMQVLDDNFVNAIKLTPSHLALLKEKDFSSSYIKTMIVGGEDFKVKLASSVVSEFPEGLTIYNEYGPTEATIGCIVGKYEPDMHKGSSVPIGKAITNMQAFVLDSHKNLVPEGVVGELYLSGTGLADGYANDPKMTEKKFLPNPFSEVAKTKSEVSEAEPIGTTMMYRTGDLARINSAGEFEYLGRIDDQVKLGGHRIELADIEANLAFYSGVSSCAVTVVENEKTIPEDEVVNCVRCGLPSNYPNTDFDENGVCHLCISFDTYKEKVAGYFKNDDELVRILTSKRGDNSSLTVSGMDVQPKPKPHYDCISLLSGGKDSTYVLARLVDMGLNVLAFTMDNGYISDQAKANIDRIVDQLGVDHVYGETPHMDEIFVDSLHRHHNVCNGCFKTIYTLSTQIALKKEIPFIVTGLSRGQFFETRLTEELFWEDASDTQKIDDTILEARKIYHRESDAVKKLLDVSAFEDDAVFEKVQFVDFYRYSDVSLEELISYLDTKIGWVRPTDTGRSTNCLINQVGIYVHKKEEGYSNYAFPYSWDVRLGHKKLQESLEEINEAIDEKEVHRIMDEIGYEPSEEEGQGGEKLVAYYTGNPDISVKKLKGFLSRKLPSYMVPVVFKHLEELPLTQNGKVDKKALKNLNSVQLNMDTPYVAPRNDIEELLEGIWKEVLQLNKVGVKDDFIALGGYSLAAIRVTARVNGELETDFPLNKIFERPTIAEYADYIEETLTELLKV